jgi:hypothetical protein
MIDVERRITPDQRRVAGPLVPELFFTLDIEVSVDNTTPLVTD